MSVQYTRITTSTTVAQLGTTLHANLIAAGWTIEFANTDAIGSGSSSNPAWDKTPAANTSAGRVIYRMPASGGLYRWYVQVEFRWGGSTNNAFLQIRSGTGVTSGVLDNISATWGVTAMSDSTANLTSTEHFVVAYPHGFLLFLNAVTTGWIVAFERARTLTGDLLNNHVVFAFSAASTGFMTINPPNYIGSVVRRGETPFAVYTERNAALLATFNNSGYGVLTTLTDADGNGYPIGPYAHSNGLGGLSRLVLLMLNDDASPGSTVSFNVDGANRQYRVAATTITSLWRITIATE